MLHLFYFITRKATLDDAEFHRYWREVHGPIVSRIPGLERYLQSHLIPGTGVACGYDGAAEAWVKDHAALEAIQQSAEYLQGALADEPNFIDMKRVEWLITTDRVILDGPQKPGQVKAVSRVRRKEGLTPEDFRKHWADIHGPIACRLPGIQRYVQSATVDEAYAYGEPRWDGVAQIWAEDLDALKRLRESEAYTGDAMQDANQFLDMSALSAFVVEETHVVWPS
jgi:uncharacterized protein (TIGR02118 family)